MTHGQALFLDMHSLCWKAYYTKAYMQLTTSGGKPSGMFYGTLVALHTLKKRFPKAVRMVCAYDMGYSGRDQLLKEYKGNRLHSKEHERSQFMKQLDQVRRLCEAMGYLSLAEYGVEGDDFVAIYANEWLNLNQKNTSIIVSTDNDFYQLLTNKRIGFYEHRKHEYYDWKNIDKLIGMPVASYVTYKALVGDKIDNIPAMMSSKKALAALQYPEALCFKEDYFKRNLQLVQLPFSPLKLRKMVNLKIVETDLQMAGNILKEYEISKYTLADLLL